MHIRHHAQRQHIIDSLETLLYQLHILSFFMAPSILAVVTRCAAQFQLSKPRDYDARRSLRLWYLLILIFNFGSLWTHAAQGVSEGRSVVLDFVGMAFTPSRLQLFSLDCTIVALSLIITTIAYETSYTLASSNIEDPLAPTADIPADTFVIDLRMSVFIKHLRYPPTPPPDSSRDSLLPMPNTASWPLSESLRMLRRAQAGRRARAQEDAGAAGAAERGGRAPRTVPGGMGTDVGG
ncbi:hypothetical protein BV25DRAFT_1891800 [Artomyces pyxidatus]|uniref:Uncharacterized protein n=1 Tax=Artomyces pyxidatus TaxID=48021 RepID=A0ACB8SNI8_9AGAM|nr:hypothetical protein BV25DRAFT_1891800 [Artomyces pyxidatus]